jgi:hypothetical protein
MITILLNYLNNVFVNIEIEEKLNFQNKITTFASRLFKGGIFLDIVINTFLQLSLTVPHM